MLRVVLLLFLLTFTAGARCLSAQDDDDLYPFDPEYTQIILAAAESGTKSITLYINNFRGRPTKVKITFLNDSVFERKSGLHKSMYVIRHGNLFRHDHQPKQTSETPRAQPVDSAGYKVYWNKGDEITSPSYQRIKYDSLGREIDYYLSFWTTCFRTVTRYEGDSAIITERWSRRGDTMYLYLTSYCYQWYNADSTFFIQAIRHSQQWENSRYANKPHASDMRKYIMYDDQHRIAGVRREDAAWYTDGARTFTTSILRVTYH